MSTVPASARYAKTTPWRMVHRAAAGLQPDVIDL